ncbi:MAG TPA: excinuclease ABC subunit UvrC [Candidatus Saccharimonadales bacterium]|nr:excinuclease ABC subunit UvrC [Candidatus Saccharimonadales bacterium]
MPTLSEKLASLPAEPGVYFFKDANRKIIYIGKAAVLKNRVSSYFQASKHHDPKTVLLVAEIADLDWITVASEVEALFLESEFIKRYKPKYNIDLKDEKQFIYIKITTAEPFPVISYVRRPLDDRSTYFGPFTSSDAVRRAMKMLRKVFPYVTHATWPARGCLQSHLGLCPGPEEGKISSRDYKRNIRNLILYLSGQKDKLLKAIEKDMQAAAKKRDFETAAYARNQLRDLQALGKKMIFGDTESFDLSRDQALVGLADRLGLKGVPRRIEAYDISHISGTDNVASMIVFTDGVPNRDQYRRFKMRLRGNDDFAHMREVMARRFGMGSGRQEDWPKPDLILIDGGRGQLAAALGVLDERGIHIPAIGLAKREEEIIRRSGFVDRISPERAQNNANPNYELRSSNYETILLPKSSHVLQLLQRVRDEAHRFAVTYHALLRGQRQTRSLLDDVPGIGPATRKKLIKAFGSVQGVRAAAEAELAAVLGPAKAQVVKEYVK